ncbi:hypothetical protein CHCC14821_3481 [Bacillus paralicheniformis]|nr:hypothetical protein CHCC14821_3481 [Bacillus paralicheniformis]TWM63333.1 hypothetical protein CHCC14814_3797 [Bacillus paralicheniformis]
MPKLRKNSNFNHETCERLPTRSAAFSFHLRIQTQLLYPSPSSGRFEKAFNPETLRP